MKVEGKFFNAEGGAPWRTKMMPDSWYQNLDEGIRFAVLVLHAAGIETCQSCQGGEGHAYHEPTVDLVAGHGDAWGFKALAALEDYGVSVRSVSLVWNISRGLPYEKLWRLVLNRPAKDRADDFPIFVFGYRAQPIRKETRR